MSAIIKPTRGVLLNKTHPLARGLVGCWLMNEGSGEQIFDLSGNGNHGIFDGVPAWGVTERGFTIYQNVTSEHISLGANVLDFNGTQNFTASLWIQATTSGTDNRFIGTEEDTGWYMRVDNSFGGADHLLVKIDDGSNDAYDDGTVVLSDGQWHHVVLVLNDTHLLGYVDGVEDISVAHSGVGDLENALCLGAIQGKANGFLGQYENLTIYDRAVTSTEVQQLYENPYQMFDRPIVIPAFVDTAAGGAETASCNGTVEIGGSVATSHLKYHTADVEGTVEIGGSVSTERTVEGDCSGTVEIGGSVSAESTGAAKTADCAGTVEIGGSVITERAIEAACSGTVEIGGSVEVDRKIDAACLGTVEIGGAVAVSATTAGVETADCTGTVEIGGSVSADYIRNARLTGTIEIGGSVGTSRLYEAQATGTVEIGGSAATAGEAVSQLTRVENLLYILIATKT